MSSSSMGDAEVSWRNALILAGHSFGQLVARDHKKACLLPGSVRSLGNKAHNIQSFAVALMRHPAEEENPSARNTA